VRWPNGLEQDWNHLPINTTIRITEGEKAWQDVHPSRKKGKQSGIKLAATS
jgi:hypothetical protein